MYQLIDQALAKSNNAALAGQTQLDNLFEATDDGTNVPSYGGITRSTNTFWNGQLVTLGTAGGILTVSVGHANEKVNAAVVAQITRLSHVSTLYPTIPAVELAETLARIFAERLASMHHGDLAGELGEEKRFLHRGIAAAHDNH